MNNINENEKTIQRYEALIHELKLGDFKEKIGRVSLMGTLYYLPVTLILFLANTPGAILPLATLCGSYGLGYISNLLLERNAKCKERFRKTSKSKNESERLEEILRLRMNIEKLKEKDDVLAKVDERIKREQKTLSSLNKKYVIYDRRDKLSEKELKRQISILEGELSKNEKTLEALVDERTIRNEKSFGILDAVFHSMICSSIPMVLATLPVFTYSIRPLPTPSLFPIFTAVGVMTTTFIGSMVYFLKNEKDKSKAIDRINSSRENLPYLDLEHRIESTKAKLNNIHFALNDYKQKLSNLEGKKNVTCEPEKMMVHDNEYEYDLDNEIKLILK